MNKDLKNNKGLIIGLVILLLVVSAAIISSSDSHSVTIDIETDGEVDQNNTTLKIYSTFFSSPPDAMKQEILQYTLNAIKSPNSTTESIKDEIIVIANKYNYTSVKVTLTSQYGEDQLVMVPTVKGDSMYPTLNDGQKIVVLKTEDFKVGDIVIAYYPEVGLIVKRVSIIEPERVYLISDNAQVINFTNSTGTYTETGLKTWVPRDEIIGVVKAY